MPLANEKPCRWTVTKAVLELKVTANKVKGGLRRLGSEAGPDSKFSTRDIFQALNELTPLELEAKKAGLEAQIDEAKFQRRRRQIQEDEFVSVEAITRYMDDVMVTFVQAIRHSSMTEDEKHMYIDLLRQKKLGDYVRQKDKNGHRKHSRNGQHAAI
jgi:hypothetical protein